MILCGHLGFTLAGTLALPKRIQAELDYRKIFLFALLPDLIDKPLGFCFSDYFENNTRLFGHSILLFLILGVFLFFVNGKNRMSLWMFIAYGGHFLLDRLWRFNLEMLCWPLLGKPIPYYLPLHRKLQQKVLESWDLKGELIGLAILLFIFISRKIYLKKNAIAFLKKGILVF
jgi:hypothetical protein